MTAQRTLSARTLLVAALTLGVVLLYNLPRSAELLFNWDSVNYALGAEHYDLRVHEPHPPGYPLWILAVRALTALGLGANVAQLLLAQASVALAALALLDLTRARGRATQIVVGAALLCGPLVAMHARLAGTYTSELMSSALVGWACADLWRGRSRRGALAVLAWIVAAGLRTSAAVFLLPLLLVSLWRGFPRSRLRALLLASVAGLGALACYVPVWLSLGPLPGSFVYWRHMLDVLFNDPVSGSSWFYGASLDAHLGLFVRLATWWSYGLLPLLAALLLLRLRRKPAAAATSVPDCDAPALSGRFLLLWAAPSVTFLALVYAPHPGYVLAPLPPMLLALARGIPREGVSRGRLLGALAALVVTAELIARPHYGPLPEPGVSPASPGAALSHATPAQIASSDAQLRAIMAVLAERPPEEAVCVLEVDWNLANWRKLAWQLPERPVWWLNAGRGKLAWMQARRRQESEVLRVDPKARVMWWVAQSEQAPAVLARAFPQAERVLWQHAVSLWRVDLDERTALVLQHGPQRWTLKRE
ncbi:MAG: hypothetical protein DHS20C15_06900 [Planctomycetota bacterium]|nr:MAG: hypothetical protein DHS20C15_06900 [Planctomycetota bacterium]